MRQLGAPASMPEGAAQESLFVLFNDRLRGRLKYAISLGLLLGVALGYAGYRFAPVKYVSNGTIHVAPTGYAILRETPDTRFMPRYEGYRLTQEFLVTSPRVIERAMQDPKVAALPLSDDGDAFRHIKESLYTETEFNTELISVQFEADDPNTAYVVMNAVLQAYEDLHGGRGGSDFRNERRNILEDNKRQIRAQRDAKREEIQRIVANSEYGAVNLDQVLQAKLLRIEELKTEIEQIDLALIALDPGADGESGAEAETVVAKLREPTMAEMESLVPELAQHNRDHQNLVLRIRQLARQFGPQHLEMREANRALTLLEEKIALLEEEAREQWRAAGGILPSETVEGDLGRQPADQLHSRREALATLLAKNQREVKTVNEEQGRIADLQQELDDIEGWLSNVDQELELLQIESDAQFSGRITVSDEGTMPRFPAKDRRKPMALIGFVGGFSLSCGLFFLLGTIDRRTYAASQLVQPTANYRLLGVLPYLGPKRDDPELSETAAQCVHQIRNRIEALRNQNANSMIVVTSPYQGDGKTSLAMALGWSYAASGHRTLLMDCDLLGRNLTGQMGLTRHEGVKEALRDRRLTDQIVDLPVPNLSVLGAGMDTGFGPESIRRDDFSALCTELRKRFDIIITDTGPFIGSVELLPVTAAADGVVFSVRRGRSRARLEECLDDLDVINVPCMGVVLNCADRSDCNRYVSKSTISMRQELEAESAVNGNGTTTRASKSRRNALIKAMEHTAKARQ